MPREVTAMKFGVSMGRRPGRARRPTLAAAAVLSLRAEDTTSNLMAVDSGSCGSVSTVILRVLQLMVV